MAAAPRTVRRALPGTRVRLPVAGTRRTRLGTDQEDVLGPWTPVSGYGLHSCLNCWEAFPRWFFHMVYGVKRAVLLKGLKDLGPVCLRSLKIP